MGLCYDIPKLFIEEVVGNARKEIEKKTGDKVITNKNKKQLIGGYKKIR